MWQYFGGIFCLLFKVERKHVAKILQGATTQNTTILKPNDVKILKFTGSTFNTCQKSSNPREILGHSWEIFIFVPILFVIW